MIGGTVNKDLPSLSRIVTVASDGSTESKPLGVSKVAVNVSSPSRARRSSRTTKFTQAVVDPASNVAVCVFAMKSLPLSAAGVEKVMYSWTRLKT